MKVSELGEFGLIDLLARAVYGAQNKQTAAWQQLIAGIGDDAAAWHSNNSVELATVDSLIQDVHFSLDTTSWEELGWKSLAVNISDIAAMGGVPRYALVSLALPGDTEVEDVTALYRGMIELAQQFEVAIVGGDTCASPLVTISITVIGNTGTHGNHMLTRSAARAGDQVAVTGYLGTAAAGFEMLTRKPKIDPEAAAALKEAFLRPRPRIAEGRLLVEQGGRTAIDVSDGLISDLKHICRESNVSARIEVERLPVLPAVKSNFGDRALELALSGGEDYELLFTASADIIARVKASASCPITIIGEITADSADKVTLVDAEGKPFHTDRPGWEHFIPR